MSKKSIKSLVLAPLAGFRYTTVTVPEWEGAKIVLREPSAEAWIRWQDIVKNDSDVELSVSERMKRNLAADVTLFVDVVCDEDHKPVFTADDIPKVEAVYGPVHSRIVRLALDLITGVEDAKKK
ncbi:phage tail protein [Citrobacter braakii]|jgi:hypothetical protein|nr:phage tail protein [Citrobacter braakii]